MLKQNIFFVASKKIFFDTIGDFVLFPVWWYTKGLKTVVTNRVKNISETADHLALRLLLLNIFKPMFGQSDRAGRIISFFMRIILLFARLVYFVIYIALQIVILIVWIVAPAYILFRVFSFYAFTYVGY